MLLEGRKAHKAKSSLYIRSKLEITIASRPIYSAGGSEVTSEVSASQKKTRVWWLGVIALPIGYP